MALNWCQWLIACFSKVSYRVQRKHEPRASRLAFLRCSQSNLHLQPRLSTKATFFRRTVDTFLLMPRWPLRRGSTVFLIYRWLFLSTGFTPRRYSPVNRSIFILFLFEVPFPSEIKANLIIIIIIIIVIITYHANLLHTVTRFCHKK